MNPRTKRFGARAGLLAVVALCLAAIVGTSSASALQPAWMEISDNSSTAANVSGTLQVKLGPLGAPVSCPVSTGADFAPFAQNQTSGAVYYGHSNQTCANGRQLQISVRFAPAQIAGGWSTRLQQPVAGWPQQQLSPFVQGTGLWQQSAVAQTFPLVNGNGGSNTQLNLSNTVLGTQASTSIYATGALSLTRLGGGTLTVGMR